MTEKLLPCPFCGGTPILELFNDGFFDYARIQCCRVMFDWCGDETGEQAIAAWNRRAQPENKPLTLDELKQISSMDWSTEKRNAWVYGIVCGWDDDCFSEFNKRFHWDKDTWDRLKRLHDLFNRLEAICAAEREKGCDGCRDCNYVHYDGRRVNYFCCYCGRKFEAKQDGTT